MVNPLNIINPLLQKRRRQQILEAASSCFIERGFHQTTMREISAKAGVSIGALYRYFENKDAIIYTIAEQGRIEQNTFFDELATNGNIIEAILLVFPIALKESGQAESINLSTEIAAEAARNPKLSAVFQEQDEVGRAKLSALIQEGIDEGVVSAELVPAQAAELLIALYEGLESRTISNPDFQPEQLHEAFERMIKNLLIVN